MSQGNEISRRYKGPGDNTPYVPSWLNEDKGLPAWDCEHNHPLHDPAHPDYRPQDFDDGDVRGFDNADEASDIAALDPTRPASAKPAQPQPDKGAEQLARVFHNIYEKLAPDFGYETRKETRDFDPTTPNGKLMVAVCAEIIGYHMPYKAHAEALAEAYRKLVKSTEVNGQRFSIMPSCEAWADCDRALAAYQSSAVAWKAREK